MRFGDEQSLPCGCRGVPCGDVSRTDVRVRIVVAGCAAHAVDKIYTFQRQEIER